MTEEQTEREPTGDELLELAAIAVFVGVAEARGDHLLVHRFATLAAISAAPSVPEGTGLPGWVLRGFAKASARYHRFADDVAAGVLREKGMPTVADAYEQAAAEKTP